MFGDINLKTEVVKGTCPTCRERTMLISLTKEIYRCITCGGDLRQHINGKISYIPTTDMQKDNLNGEKV
jgi:uncharacterized protein (DUF983 family)